MSFLSFMYRQKMVHSQPIPPQNLSGQTILVTCVNTGIGLAATRLLMNYKVSHVIMAVRTISKGEEAKTDLLRQHSNCSIEV